MLMGTEDLRTLQVKILTYGIYALIGLLSVITAWHTTIIKDLPDNYVRLERYVGDFNHTQGTLCRIENKLDNLILRCSTLNQVSQND